MPERLLSYIFRISQLKATVEKLPFDCPLALEGGCEYR